MLVKKSVERWRQRVFEQFTQELARGEGKLKPRLADSFVNHFWQQGIFFELPPGARDYLRDVGQLLFAVDFSTVDVSGLDPDQIREALARISNDQAHEVVDAIFKAKDIIDEAALAGGYQVPA
jgi:hypothetical protein